MSSRTSGPATQSFHLPDLISLSTALSGSTSPYYAQAAAESRDWVAKYSHIFSNQERAAFAMGCNELLVAHTYPYAPFEQFRTVCDFVNLLFVVDEVSDKQSGVDARTGYIYLKAMRDDEWDDGSEISRMTKEFRARLVRTCGARSFARFQQHSADYVECVAREAELREANAVLDPQSFRDLRRENSAIRLCFGLFEYTLGIDLPDKVFEDDTFKTLYWAAADMVCWANDVYSYDMEQSKGHTGNNIVTVLMQAYGMNLQEASSHIGEIYAEMMQTYMDAKARLQSHTFGDTHLDSDVARYTEAMENWPIGNVIWSFETVRYFPKPDEVKRTRLVKLRMQHEYGDSDESSEGSD
ncbi:unnamed protein product [Peniophora sp. CBMAI 1063]|nr:unnamed protein product [Peniophora sp. CBMAI 1063]